MCSSDLMALVQVAWQFTEKKTIDREFNALISAMKELKMLRGIIITQDHEEEQVFDAATVIVIPAYKFFILSYQQKMALLGLYEG